MYLTKVKKGTIIIMNRIKGGGIGLFSGGKKLVSLPISSRKEVSTHGALSYKKLYTERPSTDERCIRTSDVRASNTDVSCRAGIKFTPISFIYNPGSEQKFSQPGQDRIESF